MVRPRWSGRDAGRIGAGVDRLGLLDSEVDLELDVLAHEPAAGLEAHVPGQAPVLAVDLRGGVEAGAAGAAPR